MVDHKGYWGNPIRNLTFTCDSVGCYLGHVLAWGGELVLNLRSLQDTWPNKMDAQAAAPRSSLARLFTLKTTQGLSGKVGLQTQAV